MGIPPRGRGNFLNPCSLVANARFQILYYISLSAVREDRMPGGRNSGAVYNMYKVKYKKHKRGNSQTGKNSNSASGAGSSNSASGAMGRGGSGNDSNLSAQDTGDIAASYPSQGEASSENVVSGETTASESQKSSPLPTRTPSTSSAVTPSFAAVQTAALFAKYSTAASQPSLVPRHTVANRPETTATQVAAAAQAAIVAAANRLQQQNPPNHGINILRAALTGSAEVIFVCYTREIFEDPLYNFTQSLCEMAYCKCPSHFA